MILLSAPLNARSVTLIVLSFRSFHKPFDKTLSGMCSNGCGVVLCVYTVIHMFNCGTVTYGVKAFEGISQENKCEHDLVLYFFYIPGPELIASRL